MFLQELFGPEHADKIDQTMRRAGYTELGAGVDATVWGKDEGTVIKILMPESGSLDQAEKIFLQYYNTAQKYPDNPHLLKFIKISGQHYNKFEIDGETFYQIAVEKLKPLPNNSFAEAVVWAMSDMASNGIGWPQVVKQITDPKAKVWSLYDIDSKKLPKQLANKLSNLIDRDLLSLQYLYLTMQLLYQIGKKQGFGWDLHTENAMMRSDGTIVITDPWYSTMISESFTHSVIEQDQKKSAKTAIDQTEVFGIKGYRARCLEPGCDWTSRSYDRPEQAHKAAAKHASAHFKQSTAKA